MVLILNMYFLAHTLPLGMLALAQWALIVFAILILRTHCDPGTSPGMDFVFFGIRSILSVGLPNGDTGRQIT